VKAEGNGVGTLDVDGEALRADPARAIEWPQYYTFAHSRGT